MDPEDHANFKTIASASAAPLDASRKPPTEATSPSGQDRQWSPYENKAAYCLARAKVIFACYRKDETHDPETYAAAVGAILSEYPKNIIDLSSDPRSGIASKQKFLPTIAEIREFCDHEQKRADWFETVDSRREEQLRLRDEWKNQPVSESFKEKGRAWLERTDPKARQMAGVDDHESSGETAAARLEAAEKQPLKPAYVSPSLLKTLGKSM